MSHHSPCVTLAPVYPRHEVGGADVRRPGVADQEMLGQALQTCFKTGFRTGLQGLAKHLLVCNARAPDIRPAYLVPGINRGECDTW